MKDIKRTHQSYGLVGISRTQTGGKGCRLFGSNIRHSSTFRLRIKTASITRDLHREWFFGEKELIEVELSPVQLMDMIASMNIGDGIPCTIRYHNGEAMEDPPFEETESAKTRAEFFQQTKELGARLKNLSRNVEKLLAEKGVSKKARESVLSEINGVAQEVASNLPFVEDSFRETVESVVTEAKASVEAFYHTTLLAIGGEELAKRLADSAPAVPLLADE